MNDCARECRPTSRTSVHNLISECIRVADNEVVIPGRPQTNIGLQPGAQARVIPSHLHHTSRPSVITVVCMVRVALYVKVMSTLT